MSQTQNRALNRLATAAVLGALALVATEPAMAQALEPINRGANIIRDTVTTICLALMTAGVGIAGYKIMFAGASFRDCSNLLIGGAISGGAAAIAGMFM
jgi:hypothetical protein